MPKEVGYNKELGTVDGNLNFCRSEGGYRVRLKPGVNTHRFHTGPVFEGARRTSGFFGRNEAHNREYSQNSAEVTLIGNIIFCLL